MFVLALKGRSSSLKGDLKITRWACESMQGSKRQQRICVTEEQLSVSTLGHLQESIHFLIPVYLISFLLFLT